MSNRSGRSTHPITRFLIFITWALFIFSGITVTLAARSGRALPDPENRTSPADAEASLRIVASQTGAQSLDDIWQFVDEASLVSTVERKIIPQIYRTARVDEDALKNLLSKAPPEFTTTANSEKRTLILPMPDGSSSRFYIQESPIMEPALAAQYPEVRTYRGQGIDDAAATTRFDLTPDGFHAMILSERGTIY